jgi:hypothetical protein
MKSNDEGHNWREKLIYKRQKNNNQKNEDQIVYKKQMKGIFSILPRRRNRKGGG